MKVMVKHISVCFYAPLYSLLNRNIQQPAADFKDPHSSELRHDIADTILSILSLFLLYRSDPLPAYIHSKISLKPSGYYLRRRVGINMTHPFPSSLPFPPLFLPSLPLKVGSLKYS